MALQLSDDLTVARKYSKHVTFDSGKVKTYFTSGSPWRKYVKKFKFAVMPNASI